VRKTRQNIETCYFDWEKSSDEVLSNKQYVFQFFEIDLDSSNENDYEGIFPGSKLLSRSREKGRCFLV